MSRQKKILRRGRTILQKIRQFTAMRLGQIAADDEAHRRIRQKTAVFQQGGDLTARFILFQNNEMPWIFATGRRRGHRRLKHFLYQIVSHETLLVFSHAPTAIQKVQLGIQAISGSCRRLLHGFAIDLLDR